MWKTISVTLFVILQIKFIYCTTSSPGADVYDDHDNLDPYKVFCEGSSGSYFRDGISGLVCCGNDTLRLPEEFSHFETHEECYEKIKDGSSDLPASIWNVFLCNIQKNSTFKSLDKMTFNELLAFGTKYYPQSIVTKLKRKTKKCSNIDSEKMENHQKIEKYMNCFHEAEKEVCHKPYGEQESEDENDLKTLKRLGCPTSPGLHAIDALDHCCKKRSLPYTYGDALEMLIKHGESNTDYNSIHNCMESFGARERELMPETFQTPVVSGTTPSDDGEDHSLHSTWDILCSAACYIERKNYTKAMLKLDIEAAVEKELEYFGKSTKEGLKKIFNERKNKKKIFLAMDVDTEKSNPMNFKELSAKFDKADEKDKIQYYCKFVDTIYVEVSRALHVYCGDEEYGKQWSEFHHPFFVPQEQQT